MSERHGGEVSRYDDSGCTPLHCAFEVELKHYPLFLDVWGPYFLRGQNTWQVVRVFPLFGLQDWLGGATVRVDGGVVADVSYNLFVRGRGGWVLGRTVDEFKVTPDHLRRPMGERSYYAHWYNITTVGGGEGIDSTLTPQANAEERNRAYDIDFRCLTKLGGCTSLCQMAPISFADLVQELGQMPWLDEHDPHCAKFKPPERNPNGAPDR